MTNILICRIFVVYKCRMFERFIVAIKNTLASRVSYRIKRNKSSVFIRQDFSDIGGYDQIGRILKQLVEKNILINLGYGVYTRTKESMISKKLIPEKNLQELAKEAAKKLGIKTVPSKAEELYNQGLSTQVPTGRVIGVKGRISRKIGYNGKYVSFENVT